MATIPTQENTPNLLCKTTNSNCVEPLKISVTPHKLFKNSRIEEKKATVGDTKAMLKFTKQNTSTTGTDEPGLKLIKKLVKQPSSIKKPKANLEIAAVKKCNCSRTKCLKLYCECFARGEVCGKECNC